MVPLDEIIGTFDLIRDMWVVEFWSKDGMWADLTLDKQSATYKLTIFGAPGESILPMDLHEAVRHLLDAKRRILEGTIGDIRTEKESGNADWRTGDPLQGKIKPGSPAGVVISSHDQMGECIAGIYGGDETWATISLDSESGEYTLSIVPRVETDKWLGLDLDETLRAIFEAQQILMERQVFGFEE